MNHKTMNHKALKIGVVSLMIITTIGFYSLPVLAADPPSGWDDWNGDTDKLGSQNDTFTTDTDSTIYTENDVSVTDSRIAVKFNIDEFLTGSDWAEFTVEDSGSRLFYIRLYHDGELTINGGDSGIDVRPGITYNIEVRNIDYSNNEFDVFINGEFAGTHNFDQSASGFDRIEIRQRISSGTSNTLTFTDLEIGGSNYNIQKFSGGVWKDFSDSDNSVTATGWSGWYEGFTQTSNSVNIVTVNDTLIHQTRNFGSINSNDEDTIISAWSNSGEYSPNRISVKYQFEEFSGDGSDSARFSLYDSGSRLTFIQLGQSGDILIRDGATNRDIDYDLRPGITYGIEILPDYSANTYELIINNESLGTYSFDSNIDGFDNIQIRHDTSVSGANNQLYFNDIRFDGGSYSIAEFDGGVMKGFGDNDENITATGWAGWYEGVSYSNAVSLSNIEDTIVGNLTVSNGDTTIEAHSTTGQVSPDNVSVKFHVDNFSSEDLNYSEFTLRDSGDRIMSFRITQDGDMSFLDGGTYSDVGFYNRHGITYAVEFIPDYPNGNYEVFVNGQSVGTFDFQSSVDGFDRIEIRHRTNEAGETNSLYFNDIRINGPSIEKPVYTSGETGLGFEGWYQTGGSFDSINKDLVSGSFTAPTNDNRVNAEIYSSGGYVDVSPISTDITVSDRTYHPDDSVEVFAKYFADNLMAVRLQMSTPNDQYDPTSNVSGNAIVVRDGGAWREIDIQWQNNSANSIEFVNVNYSDQSYNVRINGELAENPATQNNLFSMSGNLQNGMQNFEVELDTSASANLQDYDDESMEIDYSDLSLGQCANNCGAIEFFDVTTGQQVEFTDPETIVVNESDNLIIDINSYMKHGSKQSYTVILNRENNPQLIVTDESSVTSSNSTIVEVISTNTTLLATNDIAVNKEITITAEYDGLTNSRNVTVANRTIDNIAIMPPSQYPSTFAGVDEEQAAYGVGGEIQWILLAVLVGSMASWIARNEYMGLGIISILIILFWANGTVSLGIVMVTVFYSLFVGNLLRDTPSRSDTNVGGGLT